MQSIKNSKDEVCVKNDAKVVVEEASKKKVDKQKSKNIVSTYIGLSFILNGKTNFFLFFAYNGMFCPVIFFSFEGRRKYGNLFPQNKLSC